MDLVCSLKIKVCHRVSSLKIELCYLDDAAFLRFLKLFKKAIADKDLQLVMKKQKSVACQVYVLVI